MKSRILAVALVALVATGACGFRYETTSPTSEVEGVLLSETERSAGALSVKVRGEITETISKGQQVPGQGDPVGWYQSGVAWYYRPQVERYVSVEAEAGHITAKDVAAHEVCHHPRAGSFFHDVAHWVCMDRVATPTYPRPTPGASWTGAPFASLPQLGELQGEAATAYQAPTTNN